MLIVTKFDSFCKMCGARVFAGQEVNWRRGVGVFHTYSCKQRKSHWRGSRQPAYVGQYGQGPNPYVPDDPDDGDLVDDDEHRGYVADAALRRDLA